MILQHSDVPGIKLESDKHDAVNDIIALVEENPHVLQVKLRPWCGCSYSLTFVFIVYYELDIAKTLLLKS